MLYSSGALRWARRGSRTTAPSTQSSCPKCRTALSPDARFCVVCGAAQASTAPSRQHAALAPEDAGSSGFIGREVGGRYRIHTKLGEGGMGAVYRAEQISLKRTVALKVLRPELSADASLVRRFNAEAELAAKLNHPNTVTLYDFGQDADGSLFIAMEFLEGRSLRQVLHKEGAMSPARALAIVDQVCASLSDAHTRGIVHRDLKPDNVMLVQVGRQSDAVRVLDFGIAKLRDEQGDMTQMPMTRAGDLLGTPQYMAPEQIRGEAVDARTDVYALGAMLYEMVTGRLPFEAPSLMGILGKHLTELPVPPHQRRPELGIPLELSTLILDALAKEPSARPATMDAMAERLSALGLTPPTSGVRSAPGGFSASAPAPQPLLARSATPGGGQFPSAPLYVSPPPGVPLRRTPFPGSMQAVQPLPQPPPGPPPGPPPFAASPPPFPPPLDAGHASLGTPSHMPTPPPMQSLSRPAGSGGRTALIATVAVLALAGGGLAIWMAVKNQKSSTAASPSPSPTGPGETPSAAPPSGPSNPATSFSVTPDRPLYDGTEQVIPPPASEDDDDAPDLDEIGELLQGGGLAAAGGTGQEWKGGWYTCPSGTFQLDIPKGFQMTELGGMGASFVGDCGGSPCTIYAMNVEQAASGFDPDEMAKMMQQYGGTSGAGAKVRTISGKKCLGMTVPPDGGMTGEIVTCATGAGMFILTLQVGDLAATSSFRDRFIADRVKLK
ncbi:MAG TPA: protein kinase [Kofleriaceae bacterium]|nr:protein kinase [Kofleriaceae bacterium]